MPAFFLDIEIADVFELAPGEDLEAHAPFHIAVAATLDEQGSSRLWYSRRLRLWPARFMSRRTAQALLRFLRERQQQGWQLFTWNGLKFDLRWIGYNAGDLETAARIALDSFDPMFQFFLERGHPVSLAAVAAGMQVGLSKLMHASEAPRQWQAGNYQRVFDYVLGDCRLTARVVAEIRRRNCILWHTRTGELRSHFMPRLLSVRQLLAGNNPEAASRRQLALRRGFTAWIPAHLLES